MNDRNCRIYSIGYGALDGSEHVVISSRPTHGAVSIVLRTSVRAWHLRRGWIPSTHQPRPCARCGSIPAAWEPFLFLLPWVLLFVDACVVPSEDWCHEVGAFFLPQHSVDLPYLTHARVVPLPLRRGWRGMGSWVGWPINRHPSQPTWDVLHVCVARACTTDEARRNRINRRRA